jgi:hypothetical protein
MDNDSWVKNVLDLLWEFSSEEFQRRVWLEGRGPEVYSFIEAHCQFFDDQLADKLIDMERRQVGLTELQRDKLMQFRDALKNFNLHTPDSSRDQDILSDPTWPKNRQTAKAALDEFAGSKWMA